MTGIPGTGAVPNFRPNGTAGSKKDCKTPPVFTLEEIGHVTIFPQSIQGLPRTDAI